MQHVRGSRRGACLAGALVLGALTSGACSLHQAGVTPPDNRVFFPSGGIVDPDGSFLYVVNSNSDLRYNAGTVVAVDLARVSVDAQGMDAQGQPWPRCPPDPRYVPPASAPHACCHDVLDETVLNCDDQTLIVRERTVRIGSFAGTPVIQKFVVANPDFDPSHPNSSVPRTIEMGSNRRMFVPVRGDTSITMINLVRGPASIDTPMIAPELYCTGRRRNPNPPVGEGAQPVQPTFARCEDTWRITRQNDPLEDPNVVSIPDSDVVRLPDEPYTLAVDDLAHLLYVGHLRGFVSLIDLGIGDSLKPQVPNLLDRNPNVLPGDANGSQGVTSLTIRDATNSNCGKEVFASSRFRAVASSFVVYGLNGARCDPATTSAESNEGLVIVPTGGTFSTGLAGSDTRGIQFVAPDRVFLLQRNPPALVGIETASQAPLSTMEVCQGPTNLAQPMKSDGRTPLFGIPLLFITCFDSGEVYIVDPAVPQIRSIIRIGRQPISTIFDSTDPFHAYVVGFGSNNISVIDMNPSSPTHDRVVQRIGFPSATPREVGPR